MAAAAGDEDDEEAFFMPSRALGSQDSTQAAIQRLESLFHNQQTMMQTQQLQMHQMTQLAANAVTPMPNIQDIGLKAVTEQAKSGLNADTNVGEWCHYSHSCLQDLPMCAHVRLLS
jgi:hypothetical protein